MPNTHLNRNHIYGVNCRHTIVRNDHHVDDYLINDHLRHQHNGHCDNHGPIFFK